MVATTILARKRKYIFSKLLAEKSKPSKKKEKKTKKYGFMQDDLM